MQPRSLLKGGGRLMPYNRSSVFKKPGEIYGIKGFLAVIEQRPRNAIVAALKILNGASGYNDNREIWENSALQPILMGLAERPLALRNPDFVRAFEEFDFWKMVEADASERVTARRLGRDHPPKSETIRAGLVGWIDKTFPVRMTLPAA